MGYNCAIIVSSNTLSWDLGVTPRTQKEEVHTPEEVYEVSCFGTIP